MVASYGGIVMLRQPMAVNMLCEVIQSLIVMIRDPVVVSRLYEVNQSLLMMLRDPMAVNMLYGVIQSLHNCDLMAVITCDVT